jgi:ABC-type transport system involved in cytochrome bd biosynthesis fused ATPase/permease subunit
MKRVIVEKRTPLSEWAFLIPGGLIVLITSILLIGKLSEHPNAMKLFLYIGILFVGIGVFKFLKKNYNKDKLKNSEEKFASQLAGFPQQKNNYERNKNTTHNKKNEYINQNKIAKNISQEKKVNISEQNTAPKVIACTRCGAKNYSSSNFCHMCGKKLE